MFKGYFIWIPLVHKLTDLTTRGQHWYTSNTTLNLFLFIWIKEEKKGICFCWQKLIRSFRLQLNWERPILSLTCWMIATFFYFSNVLNSGLSFFSGLVCWRSIWVQVKGQLSGGTGPVPTALSMTLNVGEPLHFIYTSPSSLFMLVWCTCVFQVPVQVSAATLPSSLKRGGSAWARRPLLLTPTPTCPSEDLPRVKPVRTTGRNPRSNACPPRWMLCQLIELTVLPPEGRTQIILEKESDVELWGARSGNCCTRVI